MLLHAQVASKIGMVFYIWRTLSSDKEVLSMARPSAEACMLFFCIVKYLKAILLDLKASCRRENMANEFKQFVIVPVQTS